MSEPAFGRRPAPDSRDKPFRFGLMLDPLREQFFPKGLPEGARHYRPGPVLDQLSTGTCVAHAWTSRFNGAPTMQKLPFGPYDLYRKIVLNDEFTDNDFEATASDDQLQSGTSVRGGAKTGQALGYVKNYLWTTDVEDVRAWHLAGFGTVVLGTWWKTDMLDADSHGIVHVSGLNEGGHSYVTTGWNDRLRYNGRYVRACRCQNSWGSGWGQKGRFWILADDLQKLISDDGECCAPTEQRVTP